MHPCALVIFVSPRHRAPRPARVSRSRPVLVPPCAERETTRRRARASAEPRRARANVGLGGGGGGGSEGRAGSGGSAHEPMRGSCVFTRPYGIDIYTLR